LNWHSKIPLCNTRHISQHQHKPESPQKSSRRNKKLSEASGSISNSPSGELAVEVEVLRQPGSLPVITRQRDLIQVHENFQASLTLPMPQNPV
jgi:hypothetical protein